MGKYGSLAVVERLIRTLKNECTRRLLLAPLHRTAFRQELSLFVEWYNGDRPHTWLDGGTPNEVYFARSPAYAAPRFEPRKHWPRGSPCAGPQASIGGRRGVRLDLRVTYRSGRKHLPIVKLRKAA